MHEVTLRQLEYFAAIAEAGTVTGAAQRCNVSQGAVSLALAELERLVGVTLVIRRRGKGVALTPEGTIVAARARQVADQVADIATVVDEFHGRLSGRIVVGVFRTLAMYAIPHLIDWFARHHPGVELDFVEGSGPQIQDEMLAGRVQACVIYEAQLAAGCAGTVLHDARRMVALSPDHELARLDQISLADLARHPAILVDEEPALRRTLAAFEAAGVAPQVMWRSASVQAIQNVVGRNLAYSLLMQPTTTSPEGRPLTYRPLADGVPRNAVMASLPTGLRPTRVIAEALVALSEDWHPSPDPAAGH